MSVEILWGKEGKEGKEGKGRKEKKQKQYSNHQYICSQVRYM